MTPLLDATDVGYRYPDGTWALRDTSFTIQAGEHLGIVGESGAGKTTLLRLLLGLAAPTQGRISIDGSLLTLGRARLRQHRGAVQPVYQDPYTSLDPRMRIDRVVAEPLRALRLARGDEVRRRVTEALESVGLEPEVAGRYPHEFSGGQRQRIAIARAIVAKPRILLADEPVAALDLSTRVRVIDLLADLARPRDGEPPLTIVLVSHDLSIVAELCRTTIVLERGRLVEAGATADILTAPQHSYTQSLLTSVPRLPV